jgi:hypothetical protein
MKEHSTNADDEIRDILLDLLATGLLRIRAFGSAGDAKACALEADHLHNLPRLLQAAKQETLLYYYEVERPSYRNQAASPDMEFELLWDRLGRLLK